MFAPPESTEVSSAIDEHLAVLWQRFKVKPSGTCSDYDFVRRASLDLIGRIATVAEIEQFLRDPAESRRRRLIERLLDSRDYAAHWARYWSELLLAPSRARRVEFVEHRATASIQRVEEAPLPAAYRATFRGWLGDQFRKQRGWNKIAGELIRVVGWNNQPNAVAFMLAHRGDPLPPAEQRRQGHFDMIPVTAQVLRLLLAIRLDPRHALLSDEQLKRFHGLNVFFRQVEWVADRRGDQIALADDPALNPSATLTFETPSGAAVTVNAVFLDGKSFDPARTLKVVEEGVIKRRPMTRREQFAEFVVGHENFARAFVHRLWGWFFGRGLGESPELDDLGPHNPLLCPELLDVLAKAFVTCGYQPRSLMRGICNSQAYQLSSVANETNDGDAIVVRNQVQRMRSPYFSRMALRMMTPDQFVESLLTCTILRPDCRVSTDDRERFRERLTAEVQELGREGFDISMSSGSMKTGVALWLMNSKIVADLIAVTDLPSSEGDDFKKHVEILYLAALNRRPGSKEIRQIQADSKPVLVKEKWPAAPGQDLLWALINSSEFLLNH